MKKIEESQFSDTTLAGILAWGPTSGNCCKGCSNLCRYCYGMASQVSRFRRGTTEDWGRMEVRLDRLREQWKLHKGLVVFPTMHDITPEVYDACAIYLQKILKAGNSVVVMTKPWLKCVRQLCKEFQPYQSKIQFRFTITSQDNKLLALWEPGASTFEERMKCLRYARKAGYRAGVSIEPCLDASPAIEKLVEAVMPYVTETVWVGQMGVMPVETPEMKYELMRLKFWSKSEMEDIFKRMCQKHDKIRFTHHYLKAIGR